MKKEPHPIPVTKEQKVVNLDEVRRKKAYEKAKEAILRKADELGW